MDKNFKFMNSSLLLLLIILMTGACYCQKTQINRYMIIRTRPAYTFQANFNYNQSVLELNGTYNDDVRSQYIYDGQTFGADKGFGGSLVSKISLNERGTIRFNQILSFNRLLSYTFGDKLTLADKGKANYNAYTAALGLEYNFTPAHKFKMYMGTEINASIINGKNRIWVDIPGSGYQFIGEYKITNSFRMGYGFDFGSEYLVNSNMGLNLAVKLVNLNAFIKKAEGTNNETEFQLRDDDSPGLIFAGKKNFTFYTIMGGVCFYFGIGEKRYRIK